MNGFDVKFIETCKELNGEDWDTRGETETSDSILCGFDNGQIEFNIKKDSIRAFFTKGEHDYQVGEHISAGQIDKPEDMNLTKTLENNVYPGIYFENKDGYLKVAVVDKKIVEISSMPEISKIRSGGWIKQSRIDVPDIIFNVG